MADAEKTIKDILDRRREFVIQTEGDDPQHYFIGDPSGEDIRKADWQYSKVYNQALTDGFPTKAQMEDVLKERGLLNEAYTKELREVEVAVATALFRLQHLAENAEDEEREALAFEVATLRDKLFQLNQRINGPLANTCENMAEDARTEFLTHRLIQKKDGSKVWADFDAYRQEENVVLVTKSRFEIMLWLQGLDSDYLENTPERKVLRELNQKRVDATLKSFQEGIQSAGEETLSVDNVEIPEEAPVKPKAKKGRPRKKAEKKSE